MSTHQRLLSSESNEWYTPSKYVEAVRRVLGEIDLDPASSDEANEIVKARSYYTKEDDGLSRDWYGRVFMNPPYGKLAGKFVEKLVQEYRNGRVTQAIALLNSNATETRWFKPLWDFTLCFTDHRIHFIPPKGRENRYRATHGSVFVYMGENLHQFWREFSKFGHVVRKVKFPFDKDWTNI